MDMFNQKEIAGEMSPTYRRRLKKPMIEKKRRDRINKSLTCLKTLLLENIRRNGGTQTSKLDKADILEMTVTYLRMLEYGNSAIVSTCNTQYRMGYTDCAKEALRYLCEDRSHSNEITSRLGNHLFHTQSILESSGEEITRDDNITIRGAMPLTVDIPNAHAISMQYTSSNFHQSGVVFDEDRNVSSVHTVDSYTSGYSSQSESSSPDVQSVNLLESNRSMAYCSSDSDRSSSPMDVWRPW